jgi:hypothetical protein
MPRTLLLFVLGLAIAFEAVLTAGSFFAPARTMSKFGVKYGPDTAFLAYIMGWFLLFVTLLAILAFARVAKRRAGYSGPCYLLVL